MNSLWSGHRIRCARIRGELTEYAGLTCILQHHQVLGETYFAVDPETVRFEVWSSDLSDGSDRSDTTNMRSTTMRKKIDFTLNLIPLASGGWNFDLQAVGPLHAPGYYSPLASYISPERAIRRAREHAARLALSAGGTIGNLRISRGEI